ncbi:probable phosphatase 2C 34 [Olea europaea subsp. europaea]|uniref:Probable phosphatase 2C 34 n=1 Tax=Olea europaea subsp. europaea TaxID=158383 RepID=A0A8S0Q999_OLEEU|nr:probable phosphatase 2C 34 [Olea europaea subsp. europaea]
MVQLSSLLTSLSKNVLISSRKKRRPDVGKQTADELVKEAKRKELVRTSSGVVNGYKYNNFTSVYSKRGRKGINQDRFIVWEEFGCQEDMTFCGVFDGHGPWGHLVAKTVRELMPSSLLRNWQEAVALNVLNSGDNLGSHTNHCLFDIWKQSYFKTCSAVDQELQRCTGIDSFYSGTTALTVVRQGNLMIVANVGDSRAVLATTSDDGRLVPVQLTVDLKPNLPHESERITQSRGRIFSCPDEPGVCRVWMPNEQALDGPGLAMSRAFGDYYIKDFGLISEPEITKRNITSKDQFAILATDGVWDVISNQEAIDIVSSKPEREEATKRLVECAVSAWKRKGRAAAMDDISAICLFFHEYDHPQSVDSGKLNSKLI